MVVISGPGGVGKTALAVRTAHDVAPHYPDGQLYADLQGAAPVPADTGEVLARFLRALGASYVPETRHELQASFRSMLADRRVLIVLDDAADGAQVADLLPGSDRCAVLVTARRRLPDLTDARHVAPLSPLGRRRRDRAVQARHHQRRHRPRAGAGCRRPGGRAVRRAAARTADRGRDPGARSPPADGRPGQAAGQPRAGARLSTGS